MKATHLPATNLTCGLRQRPVVAKTSFALTMLCCVSMVPLGNAQVAEQVVVYTFQQEGLNHAVIRFDRRLGQVGNSTPVASGAGLNHSSDVVVDAGGTYSVELDPLNAKQLLRITSEGDMLVPAELDYNPVGVAVAASGDVFALTRIPLMAPGKMYKVSPTGSVLWSSWKASGLYEGNFADEPVVTSTGQLWIGGQSIILCPTCPWQPLLVHVNPTSGSVLETQVLPFINFEYTAVLHMVGAPDGTLWVLQTGNVLAQTNGQSILNSFPIDAGYNGYITQVRVDADGDLWAISTFTESGKFGTLLREYSGTTGALLREIDLESFVTGFALGPTGEEAFIAANHPSIFDLRRLMRVNLVTGVRSSVPLDPPYSMSEIGKGDPTGFIFANVVDQGGDNDGDGATNREETLAGSSPYDATSRPEGPKVYLSFAADNAIILTFRDPDGLLDPAGGLDVGSITLTAGGSGNVFPFLMPFLSSVQVSPDLTEATAVFGGLPLASGLKLALDVRATDLTGAVGWDWQVTPPGEL